MRNEINWPKAGDELIFKGVPKFYYPHFTNMQVYCEENLVVGQTYKIARADVLSSWVCIYLEGHGENFLNYSFFEKKKLATEQEIAETKL